jgi:predicted amidohydrolase
MRGLKVAGVQMDPIILDKNGNLEKCLESIRIAANMDSRLIVFPECALTGYCFSNWKEAASVAETVPGPSSKAIASLCNELDVYVVIGLVEKSTGKLYNTAVLIGPNDLLIKHRKAHLPLLGLDRFVEHGDMPLSAHDTPIGKIGINICFEARLPEVARVLALEGAELIILPTNWPQGAEEAAEFIVNTRAYENRVNYVAVNRVGTERNFRFIGRSKIIDPSGKTLAEGSSDQEEIIYGTLDLDAAHNKRVVIRPGEQELHLWDERRPELYGAITRPRFL